jgi:ActR/RegA family two-component response regulator
MYESFKPNLPLIMDLRNPSLVKRHWDRINKIIKEHDANVEDDSRKIDFEFEEEL